MKSVIFCSSQRFAKELKEFINTLKTATPKDRKLIIYDPKFNDDVVAKVKDLPEIERLKNPIYSLTVAKKVLEHNDNIRIADVCFIFNPHGYIGNNTHGELVAAAVLGKHLFALQKPILMGEFPDELYEEPSANAYIRHEAIATPKELLQHLW